MARFREYRPSIAAFLLMMAMALTTSALSFFIGPVCDDLGFGRGSFTVYYSIMTASGALAIPVLGQVINRRGVRGILLISSVWICAGLMAFSFSGSLWMFFGAAALMGLFGTSCVSLSANVIIQQSYSSAKASSLLGLVMSGSGVGGMIVSLILPSFIERFDWRTGYRAVGLAWLVLLLGAFMLLGRMEMSGGVGQRRTPLGGMTRAEALKSPKFYLLMAVIFILTTGCGIQQQIPSLLAGFGYETAAVSGMVSFFTAMLAVGKIAQGMLYSRIGPVRGGYIVIGVFALSYVLLGRQMVYPGLIAMAVGMGCVTTLMPILTRLACGDREFAGIWSILSTASSIGSMIATPVFGMVYDATGSYGPAMAVMPGLIAVSLAAMWLCFRKNKRVS